MKNHFVSKLGKEYVNKERWPGVRFELLCDGSIEIVSPFASIRMEADREAVIDMADRLQGLETRRTNVVEQSVLLLKTIANPAEEELKNRIHQPSHPGVDPANATRKVNSSSTNEPLV